MDDYRDDLLGKNDIATRMPVLGKLRPGIKVLKSGCTELDKKIYDQMVAEGALWYEIEQKLGNDGKGKSKLIPSNQDYFTIRPADCKINPVNAEKIHKLYNDPDGQVRKVPIIFMFNDWRQNIPHNLVNWGANTAKFISDYNGDGKRICTSPVPRKPGERPTPGTRPMHIHGPCIPEKCELYQKGHCKLHGYIQCIIPGTVGAGLWKIETTSIYSLQQIRQTMLLVGKITNGRLSGLYKDGLPVFTIRKVEDTISRVNLVDGKSMKQDQDLIYLDANIDMAELALAYEEQAVLTRGQKAIAMVAGPSKTTKRDTPHPERENQEEGDGDQGKTEAAIDGDGGSQADSFNADEMEKEREKELDEAEKTIQEKTELLGDILNKWRRLKGPVQKELKKDYPGNLADFDLETLKKFKVAIDKELTEGGE